MIETSKKIPISRQCFLLGLPRSTFYSEPAGETPENMLLMNLLDEQFTATPFYGVLRMTHHLKRSGYLVNPKRVRRLLRKMGLMAIFPKKQLSIPGDRVRKFPYLLKDLAISYSNQVWATDITYIRMEKGFLYLVVVMDWYSRYVLSWNLSNTMDVGFCVECLEGALEKAKPMIFNSDQGSQFTSNEFINRLEREDVKISMDGRGRVFDNIMVERLWRSVKYEEVYVRNYQHAREAYKSIGEYFRFYNERRIHQSLEYQTPAEVYFAKERKTN